MVLKGSNLYYYLVVITLIVSWSPLKSVAYLLPIISFTLFYLFRKNIKYISYRLLVITLVTVFHLMLLLLLGRELILQNILISIITYSGIVFFISTPTPKIDTELYIKISKFVLLVILFQAIIGISQGLLQFIKVGYFDLATGDAVEGTIHLLPIPSGSFSNVMFASLMSLSILGVLPYILFFDRSKFWVIFLGVISLILSSVMHLILILTVCLITSYFLLKPKILKVVPLSLKVIIVVLVIGSPFLAVNLLPTNFSNVVPLINKTLELETPKSIVYSRILNEMPDDYSLMPIIGLGPGQFSSRAALIGTEHYIGSYNTPTNLPLIEPIFAPPLEKYLLDQWLYVVNLPYSAGSTLAPFSSWMSIITEFGFIVFGIIIFYLFRHLVKIKRKCRVNKKYKIISFSNVTIILLMFFLGFQENYWEVSQTIFIGILFFKITLGYFNRVENN